MTNRGQGTTSDPGRNPSRLVDAGRDAADWLAEGTVGPIPAAMVAVAAFALLQTVILSVLTVWAGTGVGIDDAEQLTYMPYLWWGYGGSQPPLYTWLCWAVAHAFGASVLTLKIVKYGLLLLAAWFAIAAMRRFGYARATAVAAMFSLFTLPQIVWESQRALTHSVAVVCFCAALMLALAHLLQRRTALAYALFGLAVAGAILAKYNDVILVGAIFGAALSMQQYRRVFLDRKMLIAAAVALLGLAPTLAWNWAHQAALLARTDSFEIEPGENGVLAGVGALAEFFEAIVNLALLPVIVAVAAFFAAGLRVRDLRQPVPPIEQLLWRILAIGLSVVAVAVVVAGAGEVKARWLLPAMIPLPFAIAALFERLYVRGRNAQLTMIAAGAAVALVTAPAIWYSQIHGSSGLARAINLDYPALYAALNADTPVATVVSDKPWVGNLRRVDEKLVTLHAEFPDLSGLVKTPAVYVWMGNDEPPEKALRMLRRAGFEPDGDIRRMMIPELARGENATREVASIPLREAAAVTAP